MKQAPMYSFSTSVGKLRLPADSSVLDLAHTALKLYSLRAEAGLQVELPFYENFLVRIKGYEHTESNQKAMRMFLDRPELRTLILSESENSRGMSLSNTKLGDAFACAKERATLHFPSAAPVTLTLEAIEPDEAEAER